MSEQVTLLTKVLSNLLELTRTKSEKGEGEGEGEGEESEGEGEESEKEGEGDVVYWEHVSRTLQQLAGGSSSSERYSGPMPVDTVLEVLADLDEDKKVDLTLLRSIRQTDFRGVELRLQAARTVQLQRLFNEYVDENIIQLYERVRQVEEEGEFDDDFDDPMIEGGAEMVPALSRPAAQRIVRKGRDILFDEESEEGEDELPTIPEEQQEISHTGRIRKVPLFAKDSLTDTGQGCKAEFGEELDFSTG